MFYLNTNSVWKVQAILNAIAMSPVLIVALVKTINVLTVSIPFYLYMCQFSLLGPYVLNWIGFVYAMTKSKGVLMRMSNLVDVALFFTIEQF